MGAIKACTNQEKSGAALRETCRGKRLTNFEMEDRRCANV